MIAHKNLKAPISQLHENLNPIMIYEDSQTAYTQQGDQTNQNINYLNAAKCIIDN